MEFPLLYECKEDVKESDDKKSEVKRGKCKKPIVLNLWWTLFTLVTLASFATRLYGLGGTKTVCWDEAHFGKHASWYLNRTFFFDVHPPLGKMLIAGMGYVSGYNGSFHFNTPGDVFGEHNAMGMRIGCTLLGILIIPIGFLTNWELTGSLSAATIGSVMLIFDTGFTVINRYILLDPLMLFFMSFSFLAMVKFRTLHAESFSKQWWSWLLLTGIMLVCTVSVKFVGLFIVLYVGAFTAFDLWNILGDLSRSWQFFVQHFLARVLCLILVPIALYVSFFYIHFLLLSKSGPGDGHFTALFQSTLEGNIFHNRSIHQEVAFGSVISLKASAMLPCGYLHSHREFYPAGVGAHQQMVTSYMHSDDNNNFVIKRWKDGNVTSDDFVRHGDLVKLEHFLTRRNLHSHNIPALVAAKHFQVTGYGENGYGDDNDVWRIEVVDGKLGDVVKTMSTRVRFRHHFLSCLLTCTAEDLPKEWGLGQLEVACSPWQREIKDNLGFYDHNWLVEENIKESLPQIPIKEVAPGFLLKFLENHKMMFFVNKRIGAKAGYAESGGQIPIKWPFNMIAQIFSSTEPRVYLLGNPIVWWTNLVFLLICPWVIFSAMYKTMRADNSSTQHSLHPHFWASTWLFIIWALHYFPFFFMFRTLYVHHYYPALYFSCLLTGVCLDWITKSTFSKLPQQISPLFQISFLIGLLSVLVYSFWYFSPVVYGMSGEVAKHSNSTHHHMWWLEHWDF